MPAKPHKKSQAALTLALLGLILLAPPAQAAPGPAESSCTFYDHLAIAAIAAGINAGDGEVKSKNPGGGPACNVARSNTQVMQWGADFSGPVVLGVATVTWANNGFTGCTLGTITVTTSNNAGASSSAASATLTMTSNECRGSIAFTLAITVAAVNVFTWPVLIPINVQVEQPNYSFLCAATGITANAYAPGTNTCTAPTINEVQSGNLNVDSLTRLCAASAQGTSCTTPTINAAVTGTLTVTNAGGQTMVVSGTLDVLDRICAASATGSICTVATINAALSGTISTLVSGGLTVTLAPGGSLEITGIPDTQQELQAIADAISAGLTITINGPVNNTNVFPDTLHLCGGKVTPGDCLPIQSSTEANVMGLFTDPFLHAFLWLLALVFFLRLGKVLAAGTCMIGFGASCIYVASPGVSNGFQLMALILLSIALWLEAVAREKIYARWLKLENQPKENTGM